MAQLITISNTSETNFICQTTQDLEHDYLEQYNKLKEILGAEHISFFATPQFNNQDKISWITELDGNIFSFSKAQDTIENPLDLLAQQANDLYLHILKNFSNLQQRKQYIELLDKCLTIDSPNDIYLIITPEGKKQFCLTRWGSSSKKQIKILNNIVDVKKIDIKIQITQNNKPLAQKPVEIKINDTALSLVSDDKGFVYLKDLELLSEFTVIERDDNKIISQKKYLADKPQLKFEVRSNTVPKVTIKAVDKSGKPLSGVKLEIIYSDKKISLQTNENGQVELNDIPVGTRLVVNQPITTVKKITKTFQITSESETQFTFKGEKISGNYLVIKVLDTNGNTFDGAEMEIKFGDQTIRKTANENGLIIVNDLPLNTEIVIRQLVNGLPSYQKKITYNGENKEITFRSHSAKKQLSTIKIKLLSSKQNPVKNVSIKLINGANWQYAITNDDGIATFKDVNCDEPVSIQIKHKNKSISQTLDCTEQQEFEIKLSSKNSKVGIYLILTLAILLLAALILIFAKNYKPSKINQTDSVTSTNELKPVEKPKPQTYTFKINVLDQFTLSPVANFSLQTDSSLHVQKNSDSAYFTITTSSKDTIFNITLSAPNYDTLKTAINPAYTNILFLKPSELFIAKDTTCNSYIFSKPVRFYMQTIVFPHKVNSFRFKFIKRFVSDKIFIYHGDLKHLSKQNLIYQYQKVMPDTLITRINMTKPDSLITIAIKAGEPNSPSWRFKIYCK